MTQEDLIKLVIKTEGEAEVRRLGDAYEGNVERIIQLRANLAALDEAHSKGRMTAPQFAAATTAVEAAIKRQADQATAAAEAIKKLGGSVPGATGAMRNMGAAAQQVNWALQDMVQGSMGAALNNLPGLTQAFGGTAGLGAAIGGVGLAIVVLKPLVQQAIAYFGDGAGSAVTFAEKVKALEATLKELAAKEHKVNVDYHAIDDAARQMEKLRQESAAFDALAKARTTDQQKREKAFKEAVVENAGGGDEQSGADKVKAAVAAALRASGQDKVLIPGIGQADELRKTMAQAQKDLLEAGTEEGQAIILDNIERMKAKLKELEAANEVAMMGGKDAEGKDTPGVAGAMASKPTEKNRAALAGLVKAQPGAFKGQGIDVDKFGGALEAADPAAIKAQEEYEDKAELEEEKEAQAVKDFNDRRARNRAGAAKRAGQFADLGKTLAPRLLEGIGAGAEDKEIVAKYADALAGMLKGKFKATDKGVDHVARLILANQLRQLRGQVEGKQAEAAVDHGVDLPQADAARQLAQAEAKRKEDALIARLDKVGPKREDFNDARKRGVDKAVGAFGPALGDDVVYDLAGKGADEAAIKARLEGRLRDSGKVAPEVVADAAAKLMEDAKAKLDRALLVAADAGAADPREAVRGGIRRGHDEDVRKQAERADADRLQKQIQQWYGARPEFAAEAARKAVAAHRAAGGIAGDDRGLLFSGDNAVKALNEERAARQLEAARAHGMAPPPAAHRHPDQRRRHHEAGGGMRSVGVEEESPRPKAEGPAMGPALARQILDNERKLAGNQAELAPLLDYARKLGQAIERIESQLNRGRPKQGIRR